MADTPNKLKTFIQNPILQTFVIFISSSWIVLEITEYLIENFGLHENARRILLIILLALLPVAVFLAWFLTRNTGGRSRERPKPALLFKRRKILIPAILIVTAAGISLGLRYHHQSRLENALHVTLPDIREDMKQVNEYDGIQNWEVFEKARELRKILRDHPEFHQLWNDITIDIYISTDPHGTAIYARSYGGPDTTWQYLGESPLEAVALPRGLSQIKLEKPGFVTTYDLIYTSFNWPAEFEPRHYLLHRPEEIPEGMVFANGFTGGWQTTGSLPERTAGDFWVDRFEVSNLQYKSFVDNGGYENPSFWIHPFVEGKDTLSWEAAMDHFRDQTGKPGPAGWVMGEFPEGREQWPVTGISWFEAAAFARYMDKDLPTMFHWSYLSELHATPELVKHGNFDSNTLAAVGSFNNMTRFGTYDLPGNVSEWNFNARANYRAILGGNYREPAYFYNDVYHVSPWTRSDRIGFRCIRYINDTLKNELTSANPNPIRDFSTAEPVSDEVFSIIKKRYSYTKGDLNPEITASIDSTDWIVESVFVDVPYEDLPLQILIYLPKDSDPPFQSVIYWPGDDPLFADAVEDLTMGGMFDFFMKSGRAFVWPVYYGTFGRRSFVPHNQQTYLLRGTYQLIDFQIACDYLESREDMDMEKLAYFGLSWGGFVAPYVLAIEERVKAGIVAAFGVLSGGENPEYDQITYLQRVRIPMLMMNGKYDFDFTLETQQAFYDFLGTPEKDKHWLLYDHVHGAPVPDLINESLAFLDKYFGPVH
jgi:dienelactone hydrolase